jgi:hypothetical protein
VTDAEIDALLARNRGRARRGAGGVMAPRGFESS